MIEEINMRDLPVAAIMFDKNGVIEDLNVRGEIIAGKPRKLLVGKSILEFHPDQEKKKIKELFDNPRTCAYTYEKDSFKKFVYIIPRYKDGLFRGFIEFIFDSPQEIPNFMRKM